MITLDQVLLLEEKVESAVKKIQQLQEENDALRSKCSELTNALSSKSEQLSSFENDQNKIECGIKKALDRLNSIENSVLKTVGQVSMTQSPNLTINKSNPIQENIQREAVNNNLNEEEIVKPTVVYNHPDFNSMAPLERNNQNNIENPIAENDMDFEEDFDSNEELEDDSQDDLGFDIF